MRQHNRFETELITCNQNKIGLNTTWHHSRHGEEAVAWHHGEQLLERLRNRLNFAVFRWDGKQGLQDLQD